MLKSGDILVVEHPFHALSGKTYERGMELKLIEPTGLAPFGYQSKVCNWIVECPFFSPPANESVWSVIWYAVEMGWLRKKEQNV
jgi:hypothetical protein